MKKFIWPLIIVLLAIILFIPIFKRSKPTCICFSSGPCPCNMESLWDKLKTNF